MENNENRLAQAPISSLMRGYAVPCIISLLTAALYNIVDQLFIANAAYLGSFGNAANTVVFPLTVIALAVAVMIGDGCCAFVSLSLGMGRKSDAEQSVGGAVILSCVGGIVLCAVYLLFSDGIIALFGGTVNEQTYAYSKEYFFYITLGIPFYMFGQAMNPVIRSDGSPRYAMVSTLAGAAANIVLDPLLIFVFKWGMAGAAVATVAGQVITAGLAVRYLLRTKNFTLTRRSFALSARITAKSLSLGICSLLSQLSLVAAMAAINNMIRTYGAADPVFSQAQYAQIPLAVVGIVMKYFRIVISVVVGMAAGCIPIVGFNMGRGLTGRVKRLFTVLLISEALVGLVALIPAEIFPDRLIALFGARNESAYYAAFARRAFRVYLCAMVLACVNKAAFIFLQAMGKAVASTALSMVREIVFGVGFALALPAFFGLDGVLYSMPVSDVLTFGISAAVIARAYSELGGGAKKEKLGKTSHLPEPVA